MNDYHTHAAGELFETPDTTTQLQADTANRFLGLMGNWNDRQAFSISFIMPSSLSF